jgi:hypothetical protein
MTQALYAHMNYKTIKKKEQGVQLNNIRYSLRRKINYDKGME